MLSESWDSKLGLHRKTGKPLTAGEGSEVMLVEGTERSEPGSGKPVGPCRKGKKMSQEVRNMLM